MRSKKIISFVILIFLAVGFGCQVRAAGDVFIILQVRGDEECCQPGETENLIYQLEQLQQYDLPASFLFRYDALQNEEMVTAFLAAKEKNPKLTAGLWVEVTPRLASASGVTYHGVAENWSKAENSLLVGYTPDERKLLLNTLITQFHQVMPSETLLVGGGWGIDTASLNYLESLGVRIWQTVREQWGVDSYTVNGSVINNPYFPSYNWYLVPSNQIRSLIVIKHTISDPYHNYGDSTSSYTSQPNDFEHANLTVADYFAPLLDQALNPADGERGWATIGLETSMAREYQEQFGQQLALVADELKQQPDSRAVGVSEALLRFSQPDELAQITLAHDLLKNERPLMAFWVETATYRLRFRLTEKGVILDDVRVYDENYEDYYNENVAEGGFHGVIPAVYAEELALKSIYRGGDKYLNFYTVVSDVEPQTGVVFPAAEATTVQVETRDGKRVLTYQTLTGEQVEFSFEQKQWQSTVVGENIGESLDLGGIVTQTQIATDEGGMIFTYESKAEQLRMAQNAYRSLLFPEVKAGEPAVNQSFFDWRNPYTMAGLLPARLVLYPLDENSYPVAPSNLSLVVEPEVTVTIGKQQDEYLFIDFASETTQKVTVKTYFGEQLANEQNIYFVADCATDWQKCGFKIEEWWRFLRWKIQNKLGEE